MKAKGFHGTLARAIHTRFPCGSATEWLNLAAYINSPDRSTKSTTSHFNVFCVLVNIRFQVLFHSPPGVLFTFPSQYCSTIGHQVVFRLGGWSPRVPIGFHVSDGTPDTAGCFAVSPTGLSPSTVSFPTLFDYGSAYPCAVHTPAALLRPVWPPPLSLATTRGISVDFSSSGYLDVSVPRVPLIRLCIHRMIHGSSPCVFPHSEICGYNAHLRLPAAYRSLSRPSSAPDAKAFTLCSSSLERPYGTRIFCLLRSLLRRTVDMRRSGSRSLNCLSFITNIRDCTFHFREIALPNLERPILIA